MHSYSSTDPAASRREDSRRADGRFGQQNFSRASRVDLADVSDPDLPLVGVVEELPLSGGRDLESALPRHVADHLAREGITAAATYEGTTRIEMGYAAERSTVRFQDPSGQRSLAIEHLYEVHPTSMTAAGVLADVLGRADSADGTLDDYVEEYGYDPEVDLEQAEEEYAKILDETRRAEEFLGQEAFNRLRAAAQPSD
ncbi:hypothetical protein [Brachybacterium paraconglomeratum]|uniref:hypothetical protein n=1 Tax=Brachybacterium paraconglomeratum TaxID=173362 RepID=UPI0022AECA8B|nr:hypothetical protein [Brachybacterium paraconglomeratum]MCZ4326754.1 hypothetical protein [Brachybacterium paraconglomeratum]